MDVIAMDILKLSSISILELNDYILDKCNREDRIRLLQNVEIRKKYFDTSNYNYALLGMFLIKLKDDVSYLFDEAAINLMFDNNFLTSNCIWAVMLFAPDLISKFSYDDRILKTIVDDEFLVRHVYDYDYNFGKYFFDYILNNNKINYFFNLNPAVQLELLKDKNNLIRFKNINLSDRFISMLSKDIIEYLLRDYYFYHKIINMDIGVIDSIANKGVHLPICGDIINKYLSIDDINLYSAYVSNLDIANSYLKDMIILKKNNMYDQIFDRVSSNGLIEEYNTIYEDYINGREIKHDDIDLIMGLCGSNKDVYDYLYRESSYLLKEVFINRFFEDIPYNFMVNLEMMLNFIERTSCNIIDNDRLLLYKNIYNFDNKSISEKINLYNSMKNGISYTEIFYDDYRKCKEFAYSLYNDKVLNPSNMDKSDLSSVYGIDVYELNGEEFVSFVHQTKIYREDRLNEAFYDDESSFWRESGEDITTASISMIDHNHFDVIYSYESYVTFGFSNLDVDRIIHVYHSDSLTKGYEGSNKINEIFTSDELLNKTKGYNEILYAEKNEAIINGNKYHTILMPSYVLCYGKIYDIEVRIAKKYNIPIVLFHVYKYKNIVDPTVEFSDDLYLTGYENKKKKYL